MTHTESIVENAPHLADEWTPTQEDWDWYLSELSDDYAENFHW